MGVFYPEKSQQNWLFPVFNRKFQEFQKSGLNETYVCGRNLSEYTIMEQQAGCNRRVQEVVRVKQRKKKKLELNRSPTVWTTGVQSAAFGLVLICSAESPCELRCVNSLTSDRCLGARVSDPPLSPMIFFLRLAPRGFFLHWNGHGVFFPVVVCVNNKKSPRTGRFFSPVRPMRA